MEVSVTEYNLFLSFRIFLRESNGRLCFEVLCHLNDNIFHVGIYGIYFLCVNVQ
jgi:hypothetical protein